MSVVVENLTKYYGNNKALDSISFRAGKGNILGLLGPNGAGKTTAMKIITAYLKADMGEVLVCGCKVSEDSVQVKKLIGYLPENNPLYLDMYVVEYLRFISRLHNISNRNLRIRQVLEMTGLGKERKKKIKQLSKGYRQRVGLAQAIIHDPEVLILDEPTSGLDPNQITQIRELIKNLGKEKTVIFSTHIMQEVQAICDEFVIIHKGQISINESIERIGNSFGSGLLKVNFEKEINSKQLRIFAGVKEIISKGENKYHILLEGDNDIRREIFDFAVSHGNRILEMNWQQKNLEEIFKEYTQ